MMDRNMAPESCPYPHPWQPGDCYLLWQAEMKVANQLTFELGCYLGSVAETNGIFFLCQG
jgi:hypothetical protein